jgi:hypothetical protein
MYIQTVTLILNDQHSDPPPELSFEDIVLHMLRHGFCIRLVKIKDKRTWCCEDENLNNMLNGIHEAISRPALELSINWEDLYVDNAVVKPLSEMKDKLISLSVTGIDFADDVPYWLFLLECNSLCKLEMWFQDDLHASKFFDGPFDFEFIRKSAPLESFSCDSAFFRSLPATIRHLQIGKSRMEPVILTCDAWKAISDIEHLETFRIAAEFPSWESLDLPRFKSTGLRYLQASISECSVWTTAYDQMIRSIVQDCEHLEYLELEDLSTPTNLYSSIFGAPQDLAFVYVRLDGREHADESFSDLLEGVQNAPNLTDLAIPWPAPNERLTLEMCTHLARSCPNLREIEFRAPYSVDWEVDAISVTDYSQSNTIDETEFDDDDLTSNIRSETESIIYEFIDKSSPCLVFCTVTKFLRDDDWFQPVIKLSLDSVRKHISHG